MPYTDWTGREQEDGELDEMRRRRCPWCGDHFRYPGYPDGLEVYCSPACKRAAWHDDADGTAAWGRGAEEEAPPEPEPATWAEHIRRQVREGVRAALAEETPF